MISKLTNYFKQFATDERRSKFLEAALCNGLVTLFVKACMIAIHHAWVLCFTNEVPSVIDFLFLPLGGGESVRTLFSTLLVVSFIVGLIQYFFFSSVRIFFYLFLNWFIASFPLERGYRIFVDIYIRSRVDIDPKVYEDEGWESGYRQRRFVFMVLCLGGLQFYFLAVMVSFINLAFTAVSTLLNPPEPAYVSVHQFREVLKTEQLRINLLDFFPDKKLVIEALFINKDQVNLIQPWLMLVYVVMNKFKRDDVFIQSRLYRSLERNLDYLYHKSSVEVSETVDDEQLWRQPFPLEHIPVLQAGFFGSIMRRAGRDAAAATGTVVVVATGVTVKGYQDRKTLQTQSEEERKTLQTRTEAQYKLLQVEGEEERKTLQTRAKITEEQAEFDSKIRRQELSLLQEYRDDQLKVLESNRIISSNVRAQLTVDVHKNYMQQANAVVTRPSPSGDVAQNTVKLSTPLEEGRLLCIIRIVKDTLDTAWTFFVSMIRLIVTLLGF